MFQSNNYIDNKIAHLEEDVEFNIFFVSSISRPLQNQLDDWLEYDNPINVSVDRIRKAKKTGQKIVKEVDINKRMKTSTDGDILFGSDILKLVLRDKNKNFCIAYEYQDSLPFLRERNTETDTPMCIPLGGRLLVNKGTTIRHGALLLTRKQCKYLGVDEQDKELFDQLNTGIVQKYIDVLRDELNASCAN